MSPDVTLYHNPRCSKSRQALQLLRERGVEPKIVEYLKTPLRGEQLSRLIRMLSIRPHELLRRGEPAYREAGLSPQSDDGAIIRALESHPILLERPIAVAGKRAVIGRPPENVLDLL